MEAEVGALRTSWFKQHVVEIIGAIIALILLVFAWKARSSSGTTTITPAVTGSANQNAPQDMSQFATLSDLTNAIQGVTQQEQQDIAALAQQITTTQGSISSGLSSLKSTLQGAEQADVQSLTAQLQTQAKQLSDAQASLQSQIAAAQQAGQAALAAGLQQQSAALSSVQQALGSQVQQLQTGQTSNAQAISALQGSLSDAQSQTLGAFQLVGTSINALRSGVNLSGGANAAIYGQGGFLAPGSQYRTF